MAVVAVLEIHMERNAVASMKPRISFRGPVPTAEMIPRAIRLCRPQRSMVTARRKPPMKRKISSLA